jgi:hypothetical protein
MEATLNKFVRTKTSQNYEVIDEIRKRIRERIEAEYSEELNALRDENQYFYQKEKVFRDQAKEVVKSAYTHKNRILVKTQVGKNGSIIHEYIGHIEKIYSGGDCFDMIDTEIHDGKPFTIGLSCLLSIKILN